MTLYGELQRADWLRLKSLEPADVPDVLILHGEWGLAGALERWRSAFAGEVCDTEWNALLGTHAGVDVMVAGVFGSPMAAFVAHPLCQMGTQLVVQTGYFGGLSPTVDYGDVLLVTHADCHDGVAPSYVSCPPDGYAAEPGLLARMRRICTRKELPFAQGKVISTDAVLTEDLAKIRRWQERGFVGVDMETATTFSVAHAYGSQAVAILNLSDHLDRGDSFFEYTDERRQLEANTDMAIRDVILEFIEESFSS
ncbi:uridine phosphorylase [Persicimonas caeni]|uniref:Uridine phosphorylase n=1 Tax=Persicimonas caeni TaxID=2292766 RepID=A0A4Y6PTP6_PERCE|nr:uridine phosphorylase [Persicimonas caeni]QDG51145.1 uridine phosphorylase [Persicimonas caeni]QED32366.1 uridine phosphorylase [Persicimonas caeni]